jgi:hypothetical protein
MVLCALLLVVANDRAVCIVFLSFNELHIYLIKENMMVCPLWTILLMFINAEVLNFDNFQLCFKKKNLQ